PSLDAERGAAGEPSRVVEERGGVVAGEKPGAGARGGAGAGGGVEEVRARGAGRKKEKERGGAVHGRMVAEEERKQETGNGQRATGMVRIRSFPVAGCPNPVLCLSAEMSRCRRRCSGWRRRCTTTGPPRTAPEPTYRPASRPPGGRCPPCSCRSPRT